MCVLSHYTPLNMFFLSPTQPLLSPTSTDLSTVTTVSEWLSALKMDRYKDEFERAQLHSLDSVSLLTME